MSDRLIRRRRPVVALTFAALALSGATAGTLAVSGTGAAAAPPVDDCVAAFPVADIQAGDTVHGLTVVNGTAPVPFTGEVLGVLENGIAPDVDMIMIDLDMPEFASSGGVWQGMSGSPVYSDTDNRLLGAVAYGLSYGPSPIAGVTPFEEMDNYLADPAPRATPKKLSNAQAEVVADRAGVSRTQAQQGFSELKVPYSISGVSARRVAQARDKGPKFLDQDTFAAGRAGTSDKATEDTIVAGGNLATTASYGDVTIGGVGTATSVCDGNVVGFGHPAFQLGATTLGLHPADAIYVQPDSVSAPFKVANISPAVGTITQDRSTGITGNFDALPDTTSVVSTVTHGSAGRVGSTDVSVDLALPDVAFYQVLANQDRVLDGVFDGTNVQGYTVTGEEDGTPFELSFEDRYTSSDVSFESAYPLADLAYALTSIEGVTVDSIAADSDITDETDTAKITQVQQKVGGAWVTVTRDKPVKAKPGGTVKLRVKLGGSAGEQYVAVPAISIPAKAKGRATLLVQGGSSIYSYISGSSVSEIEAALGKVVRHDEISVKLGTDDKVYGGGGGGYTVAFKGKPGKPASFVKTTKLGPLDTVVGGSKRITVKIG